MRVKLKELGEVITGNTPSKMILDYWDSDDISFVKPDIISDSGITTIVESSEYLSEKAREKARIVSENAIFVTCIGSIGKIGIAGPGYYAFNQQINVIVPNENVVPKYLAYAMLHSKPQLTAIANAPVVPIINKSQFSDFEINIDTDMQKQVEIVNVLDKVVGIIQARENELSKLDDLVKARFVEMFGTVYNNKFGYEIKTLQDICEQIKDGTHQTPTYTDDSVNGYKFLSSKDVTTGKIDWTHLKYIPDKLHKELYARIAPRKGDILLAKNGTTGIAAIVDRDEVFDIYVSLALLRPINVDPVYLWVAINSAETKQQFDSCLKGIGVPNLHLGEIKKAQVIVPPINEQKQFAAFVEQVDKSKAAVQKSLDKLQTLFDKLMQEYFG